jgi:monofunctional biosynthetic peptidoglycan transglycosylase
MIELIWGKKRILENYLNVAEMGKGIFGIEAAAKHYFNKSAKELSKREAAWIAVILPNPVKFSIDKPSPRLIRRHNWVLRQMNNLSTDPEIQALLETKSPEKKPQ